MTALGVYVHFPYCLKKCPYCDFTSYATPREEVPHEAYAEAVIAELDRRIASGLFADRPVASVFFGGGTPSLWQPRALGRVLGAIRERLETPASLEITVECNPSSLNAEVAFALAEAGVNRLSIGVQSLRQPHLAYLGRLHDGPGALTALGAARDAIPHVSADLIFGMPGHTPDELAGDIEAVLEKGVEHVSIYALTIEPRTTFGDLHRRGLLRVADEDLFADLYQAAVGTLARHGFEHYEISNYALQDRHARHNRVYWEGDPYLGLGTGAFGSYRVGTSGVRYRNALDPARYLATAGQGDAWSEPLSADDLVNEGVLLGLRLREGVDLAALGVRHGLDARGPRAREIGRLCGQGLLAEDGDRLRIPEDRWLLADHVIRRLIV